MVYKIKSKSKDIPTSYWEKRELKALEKKYPKGVPFSQVMRTEVRKVSGVERRVHTKGDFVEYKGKVAVIEKVSKKGITVTPFKSNGIAVPQKKVFISEKKIEEGKVYPFFTDMPVFSLPFVTMKR